MSEWLVDANVLVRLITGEPPDMAARARGLAASLRQREKKLLLLPLVAAEVVWVLQSYYRFDRSDIAAPIIAPIELAAAK